MEHGIQPLRLREKLMRKFNNFTSYIPDDNDQEKLALIELGVGFWKDDDSNDWYDCQHEFSTDTLKIAYDSEGIIRVFTSDVSAICPEGLSVTEIDKSDMPNGVSIDGNWMFDGDSVLARILTKKEWIEKAEFQRQNLLDVSNSRVAFWKMKLLVGRSLTDAQKQSLNEWLDYMEELELMDFSVLKGKDSYDSLEWPKQPSK